MTLENTVKQLKKKYSDLKKQEDSVRDSSEIYKGDLWKKHPLVVADEKLRHSYGEQRGLLYRTLHKIYTVCTRR